MVICTPVSRVVSKDEVRGGMDYPKGFQNGPLDMVVGWGGERTTRSFTVVGSISLPLLSLFFFLSLSVSVSCCLHLYLYAVQG